MLHVQFSKSKEKMIQGSVNWLAYKRERNDLYKAGLFTKPVVSPPKLDMPSHVVSHHKSTEGRNIFVFDDLFVKEDLDRLRVVILKYGTYYYDDSDDDPESDNVQWIAGFDIDDYVKSRIWNNTHQV